MTLLLALAACTFERTPDAEAAPRTDPKAPLDCGMYLGETLAPATSRARLAQAFGKPDSVWVLGLTNVVGREDPTAAMDTTIKLEYHEPSALFSLEKRVVQGEVLLQAMIWDNAFLPPNARSIGLPIDSVHRRLGPPYPRNEGLPPRDEPPRSLYLCTDDSILTFWIEGDTVGVIEYNTYK